MRPFIRLNQRLSMWFDRNFLPTYLQTDGLKDYQSLVPKYFKQNQTIFDIGGGKIPFVTKPIKDTLQLKVVGLDIDKNELLQAPEGIYDTTIVQDISMYRSKKRFADIAICEAVLEHVEQTDEALLAIARTLKKGGKALFFIPNRNALFARINTVIPETIKKRVLYRIFPESRHGQGFPAFYNYCTPKQFLELCVKNNLNVELVKPYYFVAYFSFLFPLHVAWRQGQLILYPFFRSTISEAFTVVVSLPHKESDTLV